jgi:hypothetical protein
MIFPSATIGTPPSSGVATHANAALRHQVFKGFARPPEIERGMGLVFGDANRAVLSVIKPMQHHDMAGAVQDNDGHRPIVLHLGAFVAAERLDHEPFQLALDRTHPRLLRALVVEAKLTRGTSGPGSPCGSRGLGRTPVALYHQGRSDHTAVSHVTGGAQRAD